MAGQLEFVLGDLAAEEADAIVNPANTGFLLSFTGVNGALLAAAGEELANECRGLGLAPEGEVRHTGPGRLRCRYVLHAVSPIWHDGTRGEPDRLARLHQNVAAAMVELGCTSVSLPAIGCGAHAYPPTIAARVAVAAMQDALETYPGIERVRFAFLSPKLLREYQQAAAGLNAHG
jgi:O-acetyl-ADP-ribose deacetylase